MKLVGLLILISGLSPLAQAADCGRFQVVKGDVTYKPHGENEFSKARINKKVCQGDLVKTGADARAKIVMADKNELNISPATELLIEVYADNQKAVLNVLNGKVRSNVKQKYEDNKQSHYRIKTKSAVAGVRGTEFMASYNARTGQSQIVTFKGVVAVGRMQGGQFIASVTVGAGQSSLVRPGNLPTQARALSRSELSSVDLETRVEPPRTLTNDPLSPTDMPDMNESGEGSELESSPADAPIDGASNTSEGGRDVASTENPEAFLPPPDLGATEVENNVVQVETPRIPTTTNPILNRIPENQQVNDTIINTSQKANVIIVPRPPTSGQ